MPYEMDLKDKKLIYTLDFNARMPTSTLAKKLGLSKQVAKYRLENLEKNKIIQGYYADINSSKIGYAIYLIYFKFQHITVEQEKEFIKYLSKQEGIGVSATINGSWDYCIGLWAKSIVYFKKAYQKIMKDYEKFVKTKSIMIETDFYYLKPMQIYPNKSQDEIKMTGEIEQFELDKIDRKILIELSKNARESLVDLSLKLGLSPNAIKDRIKKLENNNVILGYRVMINYPLLNFLHYRVFLHLENTTEEVEKKIILFLKQNKEVISITKTIGYCELEFRAIVTDINEYYLLINKLKDKFQDIIKDTESILYYKFNDCLNYFPFFE